MTSANINRFEWVKAVLQSEGLTPTAKTAATAIAIQFTNDETGQANPSQSTLADYLKVHKDTIKRVLRELRNAGWLLITGTGGRSKAPQMRLLAPSKIIPFRLSQRGGKSSPEPEKRGGNMCTKGGQITPSHNKDEQSLEQRDGDVPTTRPSVLKQFDQLRYEGNPFDGLRSIPRTDWPALNQWAELMRNHGLPQLSSLPIWQKAEKGKVICCWLPSKTPPTSPKAVAEALQFFQALLDWEANRYAAQ